MANKNWLVIKTYSIFFLVVKVQRPDKTPTSMGHFQIRRNSPKSDVVLLRRVGVPKTSYKPTSIWYVVLTSHRRREVVSQLVDIFPAKIPTALLQSNLVEIDVAFATSYQRPYDVEKRRQFDTSYWRPTYVERLTVIYAPKLRPLVYESTLLA